VLGLRADFVEENPNTVRALTRALIRAALWLDENDNANREEAVQIISRPTYVGADVDVLRNSMTGTFEYEPGDVRPVPDFNVFFRYNANYPFASDAVWYLTQMRRWGQITQAQTDDWYIETARSVFRTDLFEDAAQSLVEDGLVPADAFPFGNDGFRDVVDHAIDDVPFDGRAPNAYIDSLPIGLKGDQTVVGNEVQG
jgi:nitrate/nitrite transport system substrate-binding protein